MTKEVGLDKRSVDDFWEKFRSERLEVGGESCKATKEALVIARSYYFKYKSGCLSEMDKIEMELFKGKIIEANSESEVFCNKFSELCGWLVADLGVMPDIRIFRKMELLKDKIKEAEKD